MIVHIQKNDKKSQKIYIYEKSIQNFVSWEESTYSTT